MQKYRVVIYDEEENRQEVSFCGVDGRTKAMEYARSNRWATIFTC